MLIKYRKIKIFIILKFNIRVSNIFVHSCHRILFIVMSGLIQIQIYLKCFWKMGLKIEFRKRKENFKIKGFKKVVKFIFENLPKFLIFT